MALIWSPEPTTVDDLELVARIEAMTYAGREPRHESLIEMLGALSQRILQDPYTRNIPQYVALAYWLRPAALTRLSQALDESERSGFIRVPRGVALHLPPTNVDTIFVYSWAMSVLAGNANVVRLAERLDSDTERLVSLVSRLVEESGESRRQLFCHYDYGGDTERAIARHSDLRMIWGGDAKVEKVSCVPIRPDGLSIGFPDRQSFAIIATAAYRQADDESRDALAVRFFNDVYWFDQMGCGSPRLIVWLGAADGLMADFYGRLSRVIAARGYRVETGVAIAKFVLANELMAADVARSYERMGNALDVSRVIDPEAAMGHPHGGGFLCDWVVRSIDDVPPIVTRKVQTITHFGIPAPDLSRLASAVSGRGGYRIVPVGQALQFDATWDGVDLFEHMSRLIVVR